MIENVTFDVEKGGIRLDAALLMRFPEVPRAFAREACEANLVKVTYYILTFLPKYVKLECSFFIIEE